MSMNSPWVFSCVCRCPCQEIIQAAIAPVVLISGVGLLLLTLSARLIRFALALSASSVALVSLLISSLISLVTAMLVFVRELFEALTALDLSIDPQAP